MQYEYHEYASSTYVMFNLTNATCLATEQQTSSAYTLGGLTIDIQSILIQTREDCYHPY